MAGEGEGGGGGGGEKARVRSAPFGSDKKLSKFPAALFSIFALHFTTFSVFEKHLAHNFDVAELAGDKSLREVVEHRGEVRLVLDHFLNGTKSFPGASF